jgi:hypothetical protein
VLTRSGAVRLAKRENNTYISPKSWFASKRQGGAPLGATLT